MICTKIYQQGLRIEIEVWMAVLNKYSYFLFKAKYRHAYSSFSSSYFSNLYRINSNINKMEWKNAKRPLFTGHPAKDKQKLASTMNRIPCKKTKQASNHKKILTQGGQTLLHSRTFTSSPFHDLTENLKTKEQQCSTFAHSFHSLGHPLKLSHEFTKIGRQLQCQNGRMKAFLANLSNSCIKQDSIVALHSPKMSLLDKIKYQTSIIRQMKDLNACR